MECYWELRCKNAQNIKVLMCSLYKNAPLRESGVDRFARADRQGIKQHKEMVMRLGCFNFGLHFVLFVLAEVVARIR